MKQYSLYNAATGLLTGRTFGTDVSDSAAHARALALNTPAGHGTVEGVHDHLSKRIDIERLAREDSDALTAWSERKNGPPPARVVATTAHVIDHQPAQTSTDHEWNAATKRWQLSASAQAKAAAAAAARARHAELISQQHDEVRRAVLGDAAAKERLQAIENQIAALSPALDAANV